MDKLQTLLERVAAFREQGGLLTPSVSHSNKSAFQQCVCVVTAPGLLWEHKEQDSMTSVKWGACGRCWYGIPCDSCVSSILIHVDTGAEEAAGGAALEHSLSFFPALIILNWEALSKIKIKNYFKEKSAKDSRKMCVCGGVLPHFLNPTTIKFYSVCFSYKAKQTKKLGMKAFTDSIDAVRAHKYCMSSLWLSLCFLLTKHNSSIIVSLENMFCLPTQVHSLYSVYLQFVHTVWLR